MNNYGIQIQLSFNNTFAGRIVRKLTNSRFFHVDVILPNEFHPFNSNIKYLIGSLPFNGVSIHFKNYCLEETYSLEVSKKQYEIFFNELEKQLGSRYDYLGVLTYLPAKYFMREWDKENSWFCSELIAYCLMKANIHVSQENSNRVTPEDLRKLFQRKYE